MMSILDKEKLTGEHQCKKLEVIQILGEFLRDTARLELRQVAWDREVQGNQGYSWLGWTIVNGTANDVVSLIKSKQPYDPLLCEFLLDSII